MSTILLVDDEKLVREELGGILEDEGYKVITAPDGEEGLQAYREHRPDMVITDAKMPRREGLSLARAILAEDVHIPITMITGHGSESMAVEALRLGIADFIKKPVQLTDLLARDTVPDFIDEPAAQFLKSEARAFAETKAYRVGEFHRHLGAKVIGIDDGGDPSESDSLWARAYLEY